MSRSDQAPPIPRLSIGLSVCMRHFGAKCWGLVINIVVRLRERAFYTQKFSESCTAQGILFRKILTHSLGLAEIDEYRDRLKTFS